MMARFLSTQFWENIWNTLFGRDELLGINMGFWVGMAVVLLIVIVENAIFWGMKPKAGAAEKRAMLEKREADDNEGND